DCILPNISLNYTLLPSLRLESNTNLHTKHNNVPNIITRHDEFEVNIKNARCGARKLVVRDNVKIIKESNTIQDVLPPNKHMDKRIKINKIPLTDKTRISAGLIRERLGNPYKAYRFRTNPVLYEQSKRIDPNIKEISDYVVNKNNSSYNCAERNIGRDN